MIKGAALSTCGLYRYGLRRTWNPELPQLCWIMLNPSTADAEKDDATIRVCMGRAQRMGYGGINVVNLFALRSTDPQALYDAAYPVSEPTLWFKNDVYIQTVARVSPMVICAWGNHGGYQDRATIVLSMLHKLGVKTFALHTTKLGHPCHPLRISYDVQPFAF
jgi:hypothetical protein